ncbi:MAG: phage portal protein [Dorea sp.]|nr:phage portal protein [Dorea sp.]
MYTYEDLLKIQTDKDRVLLCKKIVDEHINSSAYRVALDADQYYRKHNATIEGFKKWLYTLAGNRVEDLLSANFKLETTFFRNNVIQKTSYLLGKGVQIRKKISDGEYADIKPKFGKKIDAQLKHLGKMAHVDGKAYGFWNYDHLEVFRIIATDEEPGFAPIISGETARTAAGIRFWSRTVDNDTIYTFTLYEPDGLARYRYHTKDDKIEVIEKKHGYVSTTISTNAEGVLLETWENYGPEANPRFPIIVLYASDTHESDLVGLRERIDCDDIINSGLANNITDAAEVYWLIQNAGGMNDNKLELLLERLRTVKAAVTDSDEKGNSIKPETVEVPYEARRTFGELNRTYLYDNAMLMDRRSMSAAEKTTQELDMAYQPQDDYTDDFENFMYDFMDELCALIGEPDAETSFTRNKVTNNKEQDTIVLQSISVLPAEMVIRKLSFLTPEEMEEAISMLDSEDFNKFNNPEDDNETDLEDDDQEDNDPEDNEEDE